MIPPHWLHIYNKPKVAVTAGDSLQRRLLAANYTHTINAMGWYDTAQCNVAVSKDEAEHIFAEYVGNRVSVFVDNPIVPIWEGFISRVTIESNGLVNTISLEEMANKVQVLFTTTAATPNDRVMTAVDDLASQAIYGVKMTTIDIGNVYTDGVTAPNLASVIRDKFLSTNAYPLITKAGGGAQELTVTIEMQGFYHTLKWDQQQVTDTGTDTAFGIYYRYLRNDTGAPPRYTTYNGSRFSGNGNGLWFDDLNPILSFDFNSSFRYPRTKKLGESIWDFVSKMTEAGDGVDDFIFGISPTDPNLGYRTSYYRKANTNVEYVTKMYGDTRIRTINGSLVMPWDMRPDCKILIADALIGWNKPGGDPREAYIRGVSYDAEARTVTWTTGDKYTLRDVFRLNELAKQTSKDFGAPPRTSTS